MIQDVFLNTLTCPTLHVNFLRLQISRFLVAKLKMCQKITIYYVEVFIRSIHPPEEKKNIILQLPPASSQLNAVADQTIETRAIASRSVIKCAKEVVVRDTIVPFNTCAMCPVPPKTGTKTA